MATFQTIMDESGWTLVLPDSHWAAVIRTMQVRQPNEDHGEYVVHAHAREIVSLTNGTRKHRAVALARMPTMIVLESERGSAPVELVAVDNRQTSYNRRMRGQNRDARIQALQRRIASDQAELSKLLADTDAPPLPDGHGVC